MKNATLIFPDLQWQWERAPPKPSLDMLPTPQGKNAAAWILNLIETIHWASFPLGFYVVHFISVNGAAVAAHLPATLFGLPSEGGDPTRVFLLVLGLLCQVFGGGISGNMMHMYEGWQVTPFRNPLELPLANPPAADVDQTRVPDYNNAWLRAVAYQMLFTFQTVGLGCFSTAVLGVNGYTSALVIGSSAIALLGPHTPRLNLMFPVDGEKRPILPLSVSLTAVFAVNVVVNLVCYSIFFTPSVREAWPAWLAAVIPADSWLLALVPLAAPLAVAAGGAIEGTFAESDFNQWSHFIAFVVLLAGLGIHYVLYHAMVFP